MKKYTRPVSDGTITTLSEYANLCASSYHPEVNVLAPLDRLNESIPAVLKLITMTDEECNNEATLEYTKALVNRDEIISTTKIELKRLGDMRQKVVRWSVQDKTGVCGLGELKNQMLRFLNESIMMDRDFLGKIQSTPVVRKNDRQWRRSALKAAMKR